MLNIENYNLWAEVCDDDELILELYESGIRPGTDEFVKLLGKPYRGELAGFEVYAIPVVGIGLMVLSIWGAVKLNKLAARKIKQIFSDITTGEKEG